MVQITGVKLSVFACFALLIYAGIQDKKYAEVFLKTNKHHNTITKKPETL